MLDQSRKGQKNLEGWYPSTARRVHEIFGPSEKKEREEKQKKREDLEKSKLLYQQKKAEWKKAKKIYSEEDEKRKKIKKEFEKAEEDFKKKKRIFEQKDFYGAVNFIGMDITVEETVLFSTFVTVVGLVILLGFTVFSRFYLSEITFRISLVANIVIPIITFVFLSNYPEMIAERKKVKTLAKTPEAINYLSISMRLKPSLEKAISFTADNSDEPVASGFRKILWDVYLKKHSTIEDSMMSFARRWGEWNEDFKLSLYSIRQASLEKTEDGLNRSLDRANRIIREGTMSKIEEFAASLSTPTTVLFALGILLPLVIGALLPMLSIGVMEFDPGMGAENGTQMVEEPSNTPLIILMMNIIFPIVAFGYSYKILGDRPGTSSPPDIDPTLSVKEKKRLMIGCALLGVVLVSGGIFLLTAVGGDSYMMALYSLPILWGLGAPISIYLYLESRKMKEKRMEILDLEKQFPDALFQLGSQMVQGKSLENSLKSISESLSGSKAGDLFGKIITNMNVKGNSLKKTLYGKDGILKDIPSRMIRVSLKAVERTSQKNPEHAGKTIIEISSYQKEMSKMERDIRNELASTIDTMNATGIIFAPLVMGITSSLYIFLSEIFGDIGMGGEGMVESYLFIFIVGLYLIQILIVIIYFSVGIQYGGDRIERNYSIGTMLPVALVLYSITVIFTQIAMGVA